MKIEVMPINGFPTRVLVIEEYDTCVPCENCGNENYNHPLLAKEDEDWCMTCNDKEFRSGWSDDDLAKWAIGQMIEGKAIMIVAHAPKQMEK